MDHLFALTRGNLLTTSVTACVLTTICFFLVKVRDPVVVARSQKALTSFSTQASIAAYGRDLYQIPGPLLSRYTNLPLKWHVIQGKRTQYIHRLHQSYGPVVRIAPYEVAFSDLETHHQIHKIGSQFTKSKWYQVRVAVLERGRY